jgi:hypothetical protein
VSHRDRLLAVLCKAGPVTANRCIELDPAALDQFQHARSGQRFARGEQADQRLRRPIATSAGIRVAAPQVRDSLAIDYDRNRLAQSAPRTLLVGEDIAQRAKPSWAVAVDLDSHSVFRVDRR